MRLRRQMTVVYLAASAEEQQLLIERYLTDPKPVLWRGAFQPKNGGDAARDRGALLPALVAARRQSYEALAHCTFPVAELAYVWLESTTRDARGVPRERDSDEVRRGDLVAQRYCRGAL